MTRGKTGLLDELRIVFEVRRVIRSVNPDIVHQFAMKLALFGTVAARTVRPMPYVINSFVGLGYLFAREDVIGRVVRRCYLGVYGTAARHRRVVSVFQNADNADTVRRGAGIARGAIRVTQGGSGVDLEKFASSPLPSGEPVVVLAARMLWDKGIAEFVEAAKLIKARGVSARLALVGALDAANPAAISRAQIEEWVRTGYVEWWGLRRDMEQVFASATVACLPSYAEGVPRSLLEAAACGRPIVTTDVSGCRDVVRHGESGLLVPARDAEALAGAITAIISDHAMAKRMGESARRIAESDFSIASVSQRTIELYRDLIGP